MNSPAILMHLQPFIPPATNSLTNTLTQSINHSLSHFMCHALPVALPLSPPFIPPTIQNPTPSLSLNEFFIIIDIAWNDNEIEVVLGL